MNPPTSRFPRLLLLCLGLAVACVALVVLISRERSRLDTLKSETATLRALLEDTQRQLESRQTARAEAPGESAGPPPSIANPTRPPAGPSAGGRSDRKRNVDAAGMATLMKSPMMQQIMASQTSTITQMTYGRLMDHFELSQEEREYLHRLLVEKQTTVQNLGMQMMSPGLSDDDRDGIRAKLVEAWTGGDEKIRQFLNDDADFAYYQSYTLQEPERREMGMFQSSLTGDDALNPATSDELATLQHNARKAFPFTVDFYDQSNFGNPAVLTTAAVDQFLDEQSRFQEQVAGDAARILTPAQLETFTQNQRAVRQMTGMQLNSIVQLVGGRR